MRKNLTLGPGRTIEWVGKFGWMSKDGEIDHLHVEVPNSGYRTLPVREGDTADNLWGWDGDKEKPTLTPSIQTMSGGNWNKELWHGYLREGVFVDTQGRPVRG